MSRPPRTQALAIALVNWKGIFYERFELDGGVTVLEGENGAGKTTVMIGAYIVLVPDLTFLKFINVGEPTQGGADKGIWDRLADQGPAYCAIDLRLGTGERLIAGVQIVRKAPPTIELTPFLVEGLAHEHALQDLLLVRGADDRVPEKDQLEDSMLRRGGRLKWHENRTTYFGRMFDLGVTPVRMITSEDRQKVNDMLRTCMVGSIAQTLRSGLRDFLLRREDRLGDTVRRMEENLRACRHTRSLVEHAQRLQGEIHQVFASGRAMFSAALHGIRTRLDETARTLEAATLRARTAEESRTRLAERVAALTATHEEKVRHLREARSRAEERRNTRERVERANVAHEAVSALRRELVGIREAREIETRSRDQCEKTANYARSSLERAQATREAAAQELADYEEAFRGIRNRVASYREAHRRLGEARKLLANSALNAEGIPPAHELCQQRVAELGQRVVDLDQQLELAAVRRDRFNHVRQAVAALVGRELSDGDDVAATADMELERLRKLAALADRLGVIEQAAPELRERAKEQRETRARAIALEAHVGHLGTAADAASRHAAVDAEIVALEMTLESTTGELNAIDVDDATIASDVARLEDGLPTWLEVQRRATALSSARTVPLGQGKDVEGLERSLVIEEQHRARDLEALEQHREAVKGEARDLRDRGGTFPAELLQLRDELDATIVAERHEDVSAEEAAALEARLGPLYAALIVSDERAAARVIAKTESRPETVWLVRGDRELPTPEVTLAMERDSVVSHGPAYRVTRHPERPVIGRAARQRRISALEEELRGLDAGIDQRRTALTALSADLREARYLALKIDTLELPDPRPRIEVRREELGRLAKRRTVLVETLQTLTQGVTTRKRLRGELAGILPTAWLLDPPDWQSRLGDLEAELRSARSAAKHLRGVADHHEVVRRDRDLLRTRPLSDAEVSDLSARRQQLVSEHASWTRARGVLAYLSENAEHLTWGHWQEALEEKRSLRVDLDARLERTKAAVEAAETDRKRADAALDAAKSRWNERDASVKAAEGELDRRERELASCGVSDASAAALEAARKDEDAARDALKEAEDSERGINNELVRSQTELTAEDRELADRRTAVAEAEKQHRPVQERWENLRLRSSQAGVLDDALTADVVQELAGLASVAIFQRAAAERSRLITLVERLDGGKPVAERLRGAQNDGGEESTVDQYLPAWLQVREWLQERIPSHISQARNPLQALDDLQRHLESLGRRLAEKENDLRQDSLSIANSIRSRIRSAQSRIHGLSRDLKDVGFGSIRGIQLETRRIEMMDRLLRALSGEQLLFERDLPLEDAMTKLFENIGGGRIHADRLLDYREYLSLHVLVRRTGADDWSDAPTGQASTGMSTGEAIGVGAAIMMVVLKAWEEDANLLRKKRSTGTLRFLFLDEATRLSGESLEVLFQLCANLDLQLLVAAPEVARATRALTHRLVRTTDEEGREVVRVQGRRITTQP